LDHQIALGKKSPKIKRRARGVQGNQEFRGERGKPKAVCRKGFERKVCSYQARTQKKKIQKQNLAEDLSMVYGSSNA